MYTFHMWIVLRDSTVEDDDSVIWSKLKVLRPLFRERFGWSSSRNDDDPIVITNGMVILNTSVCTNHRGVAHANLLETLSWIGAELPGSYGVVYWQDDEDAATANRFELIVMKRGRLEHTSDEHLSPVNPSIED